MYEEGTPLSIPVCNRVIPRIQKYFLNPRNHHRAFLADGGGRGESVFHERIPRRERFVDETCRLGLLRRDMSTREAPLACDAFAHQPRQPLQCPYVGDDTHVNLKRTRLRRVGKKEEEAEEGRKSTW